MFSAVPKYDEASLADGFIHSCKNFPAANAIHINDTYYTYSELLKKVEIVFTQFCTKNTENYVGVYTTENVWTYAAILAVSLSGAAYVPINPRLPKHKQNKIIEESGLRLIITERNFDSPFQLLLDTKSEARTNPKQNIVQETAYLLFTSGSTGEPKGVPVSKKNISAFFAHYDAHFDFNEKDKFLQPYELSFDVSVFSLFSALNAGACVYIVSDSGFKYLNSLNTIITKGITVCSMVPTVLQLAEKYLGSGMLPTLRYSFFSGDKLYENLAAKWQSAAGNAKIYNCYGPTETTIVCTSYLLENDNWKTESVNGIVPLGKPFSGMEYVLIDETGQVTKDVIGELCFAGPQVISAYLGNAQKNCFFKYAGKQYYKTGDLVDVNAEGNLIFYGRTDTQVKINGYRVELTEIEHVISKATNRNVQVLEQVGKNISSLVAIIEGTEMNVQDLKQQLQNLLPAYMIPLQFLFVPHFPKNMNDKIDRQQLKRILQ